MEKKIKIHKLNIVAKKLMNNIHDMIGEKEFVLYGSTPINLLLNKKNTIEDLDIVIRGTNQQKIKNFVKKIKNRGFTIIEPYRKYIIHKNKKVVLVYAKYKKFFFDMVFLKDLELIGHFNIDSLFFRYPQMDCVDRFNALEGIKSKKIKLVIKITKENPLLLLGRILRLCAKYNISLQGVYCKKIISSLLLEIKKYKIKNNFDSDAYYSCVSSLLKSIIQSRYKKYFIKSLIKYPELENVFNTFSYELTHKMSRVKKKEDIIMILYKYLDNLNKEFFKKRIKKLKARKWDDQDVKCFYHIANK
jgi:hypothetical protein